MSGGDGAREGGESGVAHTSNDIQVISESIASAGDMSMSSSMNKSPS